MIRLLLRVVFGVRVPFWQAFLMTVSIFFFVVFLVGYNAYYKRRGYRAPLGPINRMYNSVEEYYWRKKEEKRRKLELAREGRENQAKQKVFDDASLNANNVKKR